MLCIIVKDPPLTGNEYNYSYQIEDPATGDSKSQHEVRQGDVVSGAYTVLDPDGVKRTVEYTADPRHGFRAVVTNEPGRPSSAAVRHTAPAPPAASPQQYVSVDNSQYISYPQPEVASPDYSITYEAKPQQTYYSESQTNDLPVFYFTPADEINSENRELLAEGQYFVASKKDTS